MAKIKIEITADENGYEETLTIDGEVRYRGKKVRTSYGAAGADGSDDFDEKVESGDIPEVIADEWPTFMGLTLLQAAEEL